MHRLYIIIIIVSLPHIITLFFLLNPFKCKIPFEGGVAEENTSLIVFLSANSEQKYEIEYEAGRIFIGKKNKKYCR